MGHCFGAAWALLRSPLERAMTLCFPNFDADDVLAPEAFHFLLLRRIWPDCDAYDAKHYRFHIIGFLHRGTQHRGD